MVTDKELIKKLSVLLQNVIKIIRMNVVYRPISILNIKELSPL